MTISSADAVHQQGSEYLVAFTRDGKRYSLGHFPSRAQAEGALRRKVAALDAAQAERSAKRRASHDEGAPTAPSPEGVVRARRLRDEVVGLEARVAPAMLARLIRYEPTTGAMHPRPRAHGRGRLLSVEIAGVRLYAHRVAWALAKGEWPQRRLRFVDGREANLAIDNLRETGDAEHA